MGGTFYRNGPLQSSMELPPEALPVGLVLALVIVVQVLRSARSLGFFGEMRVRATMRLRLDRTSYRAFHNLILPSRDGTTQVDHIVVSRFGVFVIETKNLNGWIFGDERARSWTQSIYGHQYQFLNPLRQNYKHVKAVEDLLGVGTRCVHSVVVFVGPSRFKKEMPTNVLERRALIAYMRSKTEVVLSERQVEDAIQTFETTGETMGGAGRRHLESLKASRRDPVCPRCGEPMLLRTSKRGPTPGSQFWGCPRYPRCAGLPGPSNAQADHRSGLR